MRAILILLVVVAGSQLFAAEAELKGSPADLTAYLSGLSRMVPVTGEAEVKVEADRAAITLKVTTERKGLEETLHANQEARATVFKLLAERGVPAERVHASRFSSTPKYGLLGDKAKSYKVENLLRVTVHDEKEFRAVANVTDRVPETEYVGIEFQHSDKEGLKKRAFAEALENAGARKKIIEEKLGVTLRPRGLADHTIAVQAPAERAAYGKYLPGSAGSSRVTQLPGAPAVTEEAGSVFGELIFTSRVTVEYAVPAQ